MASSPRRVYWDACVWIALIMREQNVVGGSDRSTLCRSVVSEAQKNRIEILTSTLSLVEVCKSPDIKSTEDDKIASFFENDFILLMNLDRWVGERARQLMTSGHAGLKPLDSVHIASAILGQASEMHTFDDKLLRLDGQIARLDGGKLKICTPDIGDTPPPLLSQINKN